MPAVAMLMTGSNGIYPCRMCKIRGILKPGMTTHYSPLKRPDGFAPPLPGHPDEYDPADLPLQSHKESIQDGERSQASPNCAQHKFCAKETGIKGVPLLSQLPSLFFPLSFPFNFMHLIYENIIKNIILFLCGHFKDLDHADQSYRVEKTVWQAIGEATRAAGKTTPLTYGPSIPDLSEEGNRVTADMYSFWFQFLGPIFLAKSFSNRAVYDHFVALVKLINTCLQLSITQQEVEEVQEGFIWWVEEYER